MQHEGTKLFATEGFDPLFILTGSEGQHPQDLGFTPGKQGTPMGTRKQPDLTGDGADFIKTTVVDPTALLEDKISANRLLQIVKNRIDFIPATGIILPQRFKNRFFRITKGLVAFNLGRCNYRRAERFGCLLLDKTHQVGILFGRGKGSVSIRHKLLSIPVAGR